MPMYVNQSGVVVCINPEMELKAVRDGLRPVTETDMQWARGDKSRFALPRVDHYQRGELGAAPVVVVGCGPSMAVATPGRTRIQCNPRPDSLPARFAVALDGVYWRMDMWREWRANNPCAEAYAPSGVHCYEESPARFGMPVRVINGQQDNYIEIRTQRGIQKANFTGIAAVLFAQYLTKGPVILLGFDLDNIDAKGNNYLVRQEVSWCAACELWTNVYAHKANVGLIKTLLPVWEE